MSNADQRETDLERAKKSLEVLISNNRVDPQVLRDQKFQAPAKKSIPLPAEWLKMQEDAREKVIPIILPSDVKVRKSEEMVSDQKLVRVKRSAPDLSLEEMKASLSAKAKERGVALSQAQALKEATLLLRKDRSERSAEQPKEKKVWRGILLSPSGQKEQIDRATEEEIRQHARNMKCSVEWILQVPAEKTDRYFVKVLFEGGRVLTFKAEDSGSAETQGKHFLREVNSDGAAIRAEIYTISSGKLHSTFTRKEVLEALPAPSRDPFLPSRKRGPVLHVNKTNPNWIGKAKQDRCCFSKG